MNSRQMEAAMTARYAALTVINLHVLNTGAWDANDLEVARRVCAELKRRGETVHYRWGND